MYNMKKKILLNTFGLDFADHIVKVILEQFQAWTRIRLVV